MNATKNKNKQKEPTVAPGLDYHKLGEKADRTLQGGFKSGKTYSGIYKII